MTAPEAGQGREVEYAVDSGWLVEVVNEHTCGTEKAGYYGAHEPGCGMVPVAHIEDLLRALTDADRVRAEAEQQARAEGDALRERVEALADEWEAATCVTDGAPCSFHRHANGYADDLRDALRGEGA